MPASVSPSGLVLELAEEFLERYRRGERRGLKEYVDRHPELAGEIREVFPAMAMMENIAIRDDSLAGVPTSDVSPALGRPDSAVPSQIGDYRIIREIGHGGMGAVYEAEQVSLGQHVALKVLLPQVVRDARHRLRFEREARAAARLHHTSIVPVFGVGEHAGAAYYVMQYIPGLGLDAVIEELRRVMQGASRGAAHGEAPAAAKTGRDRDDSVADVARSMLTGRFLPAIAAGPQAPISLESTLAPTAPDAPAPAGNDSTGSGTSGSSARSLSSVVLPGSVPDG